MKALILYVVFVVIGAAISADGIGYYVERQFSSALSLIVFLAMFFANFAVSWLAVILVMDGSLRDAQGRQSQVDIERSGRAPIAAREKRREPRRRPDVFALQREHEDHRRVRPRFP